MKPPPIPKAACSSATEAGGSVISRGTAERPNGRPGGPRLRLAPERIAGTQRRQGALLDREGLAVNRTNSNN